MLNIREHWRAAFPCASAGDDMIVVTGATGKIGSRLVPRLLETEEPVRVVARDASKLPSATRARVDVVEGSLEDPSVIDQALRGARAVFWLVPSPYAAPDVADHYRRLTKTLAAAIRKHGPSHVVAVSSIYRDPEHRFGGAVPVTVMDDEIDATGVAYRALLSATHMENLLRQRDAIRQGTFSVPIDPDVALPMVSTDDLGDLAARLVVDPQWTGSERPAALGAEDLSHNDLASIMSESLGTRISFEPMSGETFVGLMVARRASEASARWLLRMFEEAAAAPCGGVCRAAANTTPTTFRRWCDEVLKPALKC
jgi:uncharacterized protein YbjT (DUF2867 family)